MKLRHVYVLVFAKRISSCGSSSSSRAGAKRLVVNTHWLFELYNRGNLLLSCEASFSDDFEPRRRLMDCVCLKGEDEVK